METLYSKIGPEKLEEIVNGFYDIVFQDSTIKHLFNTDKETIRMKQLMFLTQFLGGPQLYTEEYGSPRMKRRHMPHRIDVEAMNEWLRCMKLAINNSSLSAELKEPLYDCFPKVAAHMVNT